MLPWDTDITQGNLEEALCRVVDSLLGKIKPCLGITPATRTHQSPEVTASPVFWASKWPNASLKEQLSQNLG